MTLDAKTIGIYAALGLISLLLGYKSQINTWAESNPRVAGLLKLVRALGIDPWLLVQSLYLLVAGKLPKSLSNDKAPPVPPAALGLLLFVAASSQACSSAVPTPTAECLNTTARCRAMIADSCPMVWDDERQTWRPVRTCQTLTACQEAVREVCS